MDHIHTGHSLIQAATEARDKLALTGADEVSLRKLDDLIKRHRVSGSMAVSN